MSSNDRTLKVGVAGLGVVGGGVAVRLTKGGPARKLIGALVRDASQPREFPTDDVIFATSIPDFVAQELDVIVDALPDGEAGFALIEQALSQGVSIVSANKQALAGRLEQLHCVARANAAALLYAAAVGGGAPMIETVSRARAQGPIEKISAIVNGTVNFILTKLADGANFDDAVRQAQDAGFAEPDPSADLSGGDARAKLSILSYEAFGAEIDLNEVKTESLTPERAASMLKAGGVWRQISELRKNAAGLISASATFQQVDIGSVFADARYQDNALIVMTAVGEMFSACGEGAGRAPTVDSIFCDLEQLK
ncbi:MAG: hypothetical protein HKN14_12550 [Marinicaulis sp.]|nr:hypothetical protein [Marinicaulis sp.]